LLTEWSGRGYDDTEKVRSLVDLFFVSVLLDAGAGDSWRFTEPETGNVYSRSEGIAVASLYMFRNGEFASDKDGKEARGDLVTGEGLKRFDVEALYRGFQIDDQTNPLVGAAARVEILQKLGASLLENKNIFGPSGRPGDLVGMSTLVAACLL
jgi:hypothetical protein